MRTKPELLAPAGNSDKLRTAFSSGADAVYVGIRTFGLRQYAENFSLTELNTAVKWANRHRKKIYLTLNSLATNADIERLDQLLPDIAAIQPHAVIVADLGVKAHIQAACAIPIHMSTQASITNPWAVNWLAAGGVSRVVLARELSLADLEILVSETRMPLEVFIHGAMCAGYSGKCLLSNFSANRDANRGGCIQQCRVAYSNSGSFLMNSRDLMGLAALPRLMKLGLTSFKIEGRMKSHLYIANTVSVYRKAIDYLLENPDTGPDWDARVSRWTTELEQIANRGFWPGFYFPETIPDSLDQIENKVVSELQFIGTVVYNDPENGLGIHLVGSLDRTRDIAVQAGDYSWLPVTPEPIKNILGQPLTALKPNSIIVLRYQEGIAAHALVRQGR